MKMTANKYCKIKIEEKYKIQITKTAILVVTKGQTDLIYFK
jgi:hypothetical protein